MRGAHCSPGGRDGVCISGSCFSWASWWWPSSLLGTMANLEANFVSSCPGTCLGPLWHLWDHQLQRQREMWTVAHSRAETLSLLLSWSNKLNIYIYIGLSSCPHVLPTDTWLNWDTRKDFCPAFCLCFLTSLNSLLIIPYILLPCYFIFVLWKAWYLVMVLGHEGKNNFLGTLLLSDWFK